MKKFQKLMASALCVIIAIFSCGCAQFMDVLNSLTSSLGSLTSGNTVDEKIFEGNYREITQEEMEELNYNRNNMMDLLYKGDVNPILTHNEGIAFSASVITSNKDERNINGQGHYDKEKNLVEFSTNEKYISGGRITALGGMYGYGNKIYSKGTINGESVKVVQEQSALEQLDLLLGEIIGGDLIFDMPNIVYPTDIESLTLIDDSDENYIKIKAVAEVKDTSFNGKYEANEIMVFTKDYKAMIALKMEVYYSSSSIIATNRTTLEGKAFILPWSGTIQKPNDLHTYSVAE